MTRSAPEDTCPRFNRKYPGKTAKEIFEAVDETMERMAEKHSLAYQKDESGEERQGDKMGMAGTYTVRTAR